MLLKQRFSTIFSAMLLFGLLAFASNSALAKQMGEISEEESIVHQFPNPTSPGIIKLKKGTSIEVSSKTIKAPDGSLWHKIRLRSGGFGYIHANEVTTFENRKALQDAGIGPLITDQEEDESTPWSFLIRGMLVAGSQFNLEDSSRTFSLGAEAELSVCIPLSAHGYMHRLLSVGAAYLSLASDSVTAGSVIFRFYNNTTFEPEIRLRVGEGLTSKTLVGGLSVGLDFPLSASSKSHLAAYLELGSLGAISGNLKGQLFQLWGSVGLGYHF